MTQQWPADILDAVVEDAASHLLAQMSGAAQEGYGPAESRLLLGAVRCTLRASLGCSTEQTKKATFEAWQQAASASPPLPFAAELLSKVHTTTAAAAAILAMNAVQMLQHKPITGAVSEWAEKVAWRPIQGPYGWVAFSLRTGPFGAADQPEVGGDYSLLLLCMCRAVSCSPKGSGQPDASRA